MKLTFKQFNDRQETKEISLAEKDVCNVNGKRYSIRAVQCENNVVLTELPPKTKQEIEIPESSNVEHIEPKQEESTWKNV